MYARVVVNVDDPDRVTPNDVEVWTARAIWRGVGALMADPGPRDIREVQAVEAFAWLDDLGPEPSRPQ